MCGDFFDYYIVVRHTSVDVKWMNVTLLIILLFSVRIHQVGQAAGMSRQRFCIWRRMMHMQSCMFETTICLFWERRSVSRAVGTVSEHRVVCVNVFGTILHFCGINATWLYPRSNRGNKESTGVFELRRFSWCGTWNWLIWLADACVKILCSEFITIEVDRHCLMVRSVHETS